MTNASIAIAISQLILSASQLLQGNPLIALNFLIGAAGWLLLFAHERRRFSNEPPF